MKISLTFAVAALYSLSVFSNPSPFPYSVTSPDATTRIITDYAGYWSSTAGSPNSTIPDASHMLLGFTYNGTLYSTGVSDATLTTNGDVFTPGNFNALPVAGIAGTYTSGSVYLALARGVDGVSGTASWPGVSDYSIRKAMTDGAHGLDLGTGVTNLPTTASMTFQIFNIDQAKVADNEPDLILTQIAQPSTGSDVFSFVDGLGNVVGNSFSQDMTLLPSFGSYLLDLFNLPPNTPYNSATAYNANTSNTTREIRVVGVELSAFGITAANATQIVALRVAPGGNSDYAFIAYNANSINLTPNISQAPSLSNTTICSGGIANFNVVGASSMGGELTYSWEESTDGGTNWATVTDGGNYTGATTTHLAVTDPQNGYRYRAVVHEAGISNPATSSIFIVSVTGSSTAPSAVTIAGGTTLCLNTPLQLTSSVTGGSNLYYQWQSDVGGSFVNILNAHLVNYIPPTDQTGIIHYRLIVSGGSGCLPSVTSSSTTVTVTGIATATPAERCDEGTLVLGATATSGTVSWYTADVGGSAIATGTSYATPTLTSTRTYYVSSTGCASALRVPVTATIFPPTVGGTASGGTTVTPGSNSTMLALSGHVGSISEWQSSTDNFSSNIVHIAHTSSSLTVTDLSETTSYRAVCQNGVCPPAESISTTITMSSVMAFNESSLSATPLDDVILLRWKVNDEDNGDRYEIQKADTDLRFATVHNVVAETDRESANYEWIDRQPREGDNFYRLRFISMSGTAVYSRVIRCVYQPKGAEVSVYPNPATRRSFAVRLNNKPPGKYRLVLFNNQGRTVYNAQLTFFSTDHTQQVVLPAGLSAGIYYLQLTQNEITLAGVPVLLK